MIKNSLLGLALAILLGCAGKPPPDGGFQGVVELDEATFGFDLGGRLGAVGVQRGDVVRPDQELACLDDTLAKAARDARQQDVVAAKAQVDLVRAGSRREDIASMQAQLRGVQSTE